MNYSTFFFLCFFLVVSSCQEPVSKDTSSTAPEEPQSNINSTISETSLIVLGTIQDAGSPHIACKKECCATLFENPDPSRKVVSLGIVDPKNNFTVLFEATPDISTQVKVLTSAIASEKELPDAIFTTHAHVGHYTGLQYLGKEATNASEVSVYAMPRMKKFLETNGPWNQLVSNKNIIISELKEKTEVILTDNLSVFPFLVPHRDEYSETVGFIIEGPSKRVLFIPDIDKWEKWDTSINELVASVDYAFLDATFYHGEEINMRDISEIPHPFIIESMELFKNLSSEEKNKIHFIHFNHTNPVLDKKSDAYANVTQAGFKAALYGDIIEL